MNQDEARDQTQEHQRVLDATLAETYHKIQTQIVPNGPLREEERRTGHIGGPYGTTRQSRISDPPVNPDQTDSAVKIKIELDLEVEVDLYSRVKGDVTLGLM